jgi:hypothetical protein
MPLIAMLVLLRDRSSDCGAVARKAHGPACRRGTNLVYLGAFFVLAHLAAGARGVMMAHGVSKAFADRFMISGTVVAAIIATWIMLGMSGMRVQFV